MDAFLDWVLRATAGLFAIAVIVAWWEHLGRRDDPWADAGPVPSPRVQGVDIELDALAGLATGDSAARRDALGGALGRMVQSAAAQRRAWIDTAPMVGPGSRTPADEDADSREGASSASPH